MKHLKMLGIVVIAAAALTALAAVGSAQATVLCTSKDTPGCTSTHTYFAGTHILFTKKPGTSIRFTSGATTVTTCTGSELQGHTTSTEAEVVGLQLEVRAWTGCSQTIDFFPSGEFLFQQIKGTHIATVKANHIEWTMTISGSSCIYAIFESTYLGTLTSGAEPTLVITASVKKSAGGSTCPAEIGLDAELVVTEPHALYTVGEQGSVDEEGILCKSTSTPCTNAYGKETTIDTDLTGSAVFENGGTTFATCSGGTLKAKTENAGTNQETVKAPIETLSWSGCSQTTTTVTKGSLEVRHIAGTDNGTVMGKKTEVTLGILGTSCTYGFGEESDLGTLTGGESPVMDISTEIPKTAGGATCPASVRWVAEYKLTELSPMYVETVEEGTLCKTTTTPCNSPYKRETEVDADAVSVVLKSGESTLATCTGGTLKGNIPTLGGESETFTVYPEELTWTGCVGATRTLALGELEVKRIEGTENGTVSAKGTEVTVMWGGAIDCIYGFVESTDLGTLTGGSEATLNISATATKTGGNIVCPKTATWTASYKFTKPAPLYLETL